MSNAQFKKTVLLKCYDALERRGFVRFRKEDVDYPLKDGFHCWVGLNSGLYSDHFDITPFVGVHVVPIAKLISMCGRKYDRGVATYAIPLGQIEELRGEMAFVFSFDQSNESIELEADRLAGLYSTFGIEYAESISRYDILLHLLKERVCLLGGYPERLACCLLLMGRANQARHFIEEFDKAKPGYLGEFAKCFLKMTHSANNG